MTGRTWLVTAYAALVLAALAARLVLRSEPSEANVAEGSARPAKTFSEPDPDEAPELGLDAPAADPDELDRRLARHFRQQAGECVRQMHQRAPHAQGLLALELRVRPGAAGLAEIDDVRSLEDNEVEDATLLDCLAGTPFAVPGLTSARSFELVLPVESKGH
jgi:hypothetical protein